MLQRIQQGGVRQSGSSALFGFEAVLPERDIERLLGGEPVDLVNEPRYCETAVDVATSLAPDVSASDPTDLLSVDRGHIPASPLE